MASPEKPSPITLRDIAESIGVSHVTVSLAMRNNPRIPEARRLQIQTKAKAMGYRPNAMAAALAHYRRSATATPIKAALAWLNQWPQPRKLRSFIEFDRYWLGARQAAEKFGYRLEEFTCGEKMPLARLGKILQTRGIQGVLLPPHPIGSHWDALPWEHFSAIRFGRSIQSPRLHIVTSDQVANTILAFQEIRRRGYERVGFVTTDTLENGRLFKAGFLMAQAEVKRSLQLPICTVSTQNTAEDRQRLAQWLRSVKPDAILTDVSEARAILQKEGFRVPEDIGLAATSVLDGNADAGIDQNPEEIGRVAVLLVISLMNDNARGIPPVFRQALVEGRWVDGTTLPDRSR